MSGQSDIEKMTPRLSDRGLTFLLILMCSAPIIVITAMWWYLPPVHTKQLQARVSSANLPPPENYDIPYESRPQLTQEGLLLVTNTGELDWTQYNIQINMQYADSYQIQEHLEPILAGETKSFELSSFVSRSGSTFDLRYNPLRKVRIYARLPTKDRATYFYNFETQSENE